MTHSRAETNLAKEAKATVALDGSTQRCCNVPECSKPWPCAEHDKLAKEAREWLGIETALDRLQSFDFEPANRPVRKLVLEQLLRDAGLINETSAGAKAAAEKWLEHACGEGGCAYTETKDCLTALLERIASEEAEVVRENCARLMDAFAVRLAESIPPDLTGSLNCKQFAKAIRALPIEQLRRRT